MTGVDRNALEGLAAWRANVHTMQAATPPTMGRPVRAV